MSKSTKGLRKAGLASVAVTLTLGASLAGAGSASAVADFKFDRIGGADRYDTAAQVADAYGTYTEAILANGEPGNYADALTANYLSGVKKAPILLTRKDSTPKFTLDELKESGVKTITIVGGVGVVSAEQETALKNAGYTVNRVSGSDRFQTNAEVIKAGGNSNALGLIATGFNFADALGAGPAAYNNHALGLSEADDIDDDVVAALKAAGVTRVLVLGGPTIVSDKVVAELQAAGITLEKRIFGADRSETSTALADYEIANLGFTNTAANVASGYVDGYGADALAGGPLTGQQKRPLLITRDVNNVGDLDDWMTDNANTLVEGTIFGGTGAVSTSAQNTLEKAAQATTTNQDFTVTPQESASLVRVANPDTDASDNRQYSVSGLDNTKTYTVGLFLQSEVTTGADNQTRFADTNGNNIADRTAPTSDITVVNGASQPANTSVVRVSPVNGTISFTVDGDSANETVVPVVWLDSANNGDLDLVKPATANNDAKAPSEDFGVGGATTYTPAAATSGLVTADTTVESVNKDANSITTATAVYAYDANDNYYIVAGETGDVPEAAVTPDQQVTMAEFEAQVSKNDELDGFTFYQANSELPSRWVLEDLSPAAPSAPSASNVTDTTAVLTVPAADVANAEKVTVYGEVDSGADPTVTTKSTVVATATADADPKTAEFQINVTGLKADTTYDFAVTQTVDGEESALSAELENVATRPGPVDKPTITDAVLTTDSVVEGLADAGDVWTVTFSESMAAGTVANSVVALTDVDGDTIQVKCDATAADGTGSNTADNDTSAFCALGNGADATVTNDTVTVTLTEDAIDRNAAGDTPFPGAVEYPLTITAITGLTDDDGDAATVDVTNSTDKVVDREA